MLVGLLWDSYKELESQNQVVILGSSRKIDFFFIFKCKFKYFPFSSRSSKTNFGSTKGKKKKEKRKNKERNKHNKIHISIKGQHKVKGESSSIREAEETGIWTMYLTPHRHALGTTMNKRQESRKKTNQKEGDPLSYTEQYIQTERENRTLTVCSPEMRRRGRAGVGNDKNFFAHANNGHREKFKRTWRTPREHLTARDRREPKAWIPAKHPTYPNSLWASKSQQQKMLTRVGGRLFKVEGQSFLLDLGMALRSQKSKP